MDACVYKKIGTLNSITRVTEFDARSDRPQISKEEKFGKLLFNLFSCMCKILQG